MKNHCNRANGGNAGGCEFGGDKEYRRTSKARAAYCQFSRRFLHNFSGCPKDDTELAVQMADAFEKLINP